MLIQGIEIGDKYMTIKELGDKCGWKLLTHKGAEDREVSDCYVGDLLSWVMGRAKEDNVWLTVMGNVNAVAVASLADVSGIVLTESASLDAEAKERAEQRGIPVYSAEENSFNTAIKVYECIKS